ncbi:hypothetical protein BB558_006808 [Smittium angustum]|uniref:AMP-dependent synthetase/ligase domain-containing protein n=1 Tax=Smittium angustum TaxID=133377 RepID=A0A2U1IWQ4_SMIAN|nr:hypothetical protein BB558_006808 [Smittium angustum]
MSNTSANSISVLNSAPEPIWVPKNIEEHGMSKFMQYCNKRFNLSLKNYDDFYEWSIAELDKFWGAVWDYSGIISHTPYTEVLDTTKRIDEIPNWFKGVSINFTENALERFKNSDKVAIYVRGEQEHKSVTFKELYFLVAQAASSLKKLGVKKGDRVAGYITNCAEAIIIFLAVVSMGAIWCSAPPEFGVTAAVDRFSQITPKIYITLDKSTYNAKTTILTEKNLQVLISLPTVEKVIIIETGNKSTDILKKIPCSMSWDSFLEMSTGATKISYELLSFDHPIFILFSSGTTGKPKCITHCTGGYTLMAYKTNLIDSGMDRNDVYFCYSTTGWIMWNSLPPALVCGASVVAYEGNPLGPKISVLWDMAEEVGVTKFGASPKYLQTLEDNGYYPKDHHDLSKITTLQTTGSPLKSNNYDFVYNHIKKDIFLNNITGGTEVNAVFIGGIPILPIYRGEIPRYILGMAVECWDSNGNAIVGEPGDLVCKKPFPTMPRFFWGDTPEKSRYMSSYFERFPGIWFHGDFLKVNPITKGVVMLGRSDGTLNPNGVRFGSSDIYNIVEEFDEVLDSLVVGQQLEQFERVLLFITLKDKSNANINDLKNRINQTIRSSLSPRHMPARIIVLEKIPYTGNGKKVEIAVKLLLGKVYNLAQEYTKLSGSSTPKKEVADHVRKVYALDERTIQSVADPSAIFQFLSFDELMFDFDTKSKL